MTATPRTDRLATIGALVTVVAFAPTLAGYPAIWISESGEHGFLLALATLWLVWRERSVFSQPLRPWAPALLCAAAFSGVWLLGAAMRVALLVNAAAPIVLWCWAAATYGKRAGVRLAPAAALLLLAAPVWEVTTAPLQGIAVLASRAAVSLVGIPAEFDGDLIHIPHGTFQIERGCSGVKYLTSGLGIAVLHVSLSLSRWTTRLGLVALGAGLAIISNWTRIVSLILIGHATEMESSLMEEHVGFGWLVFLGMLVVFFVVAEMVLNREAKRAGSESTEAGEESAPAEPRSTVGWATTAAVIGPALFLLVGAIPERTPPGLELRGVESEWSRVAERRPYDWEPGFTNEDDRETALWRGRDGVVAADVVRYRREGVGSELIGAANVIAQPEALALSRPIGPVARRFLREAIVLEDGVPVLVWYWYRVGGVQTPSTLRAKLLEAVAFLSRTTTSELIAVSTACEAESCEAAANRLSSFLDGG